MTDESLAGDPPSQYLGAGSPTCSRTELRTETALMEEIGI